MDSINHRLPWRAKIGQPNVLENCDGEPILKVIGRHATADAAFVLGMVNSDGPENEELEELRELVEDLSANPFAPVPGEEL